MTDVQHLTIRLAGETDLPKLARLHACYGYLTNMYVEPHLRGRGVGSRTIQALLAHALADGLEFVIL